MKTDQSMGVIIFYRFPRSIKYLIIKHQKGHWSFPKGHANGNETKLKTALRELKEETSISDIQLIKKSVLLKESYKFTNGKGVKILKKVNYFIAEAKNKKVKIDYKEVVNFKWCTFKAGLEKTTFNESKSILKKADKIIRKYTNEK
ncbi:MAG: NUDIX domain-containing protein [Ignavibacteria bacterium]|jgi:8-oxo-dGTP pyrophosphatase MutT (NUDIX family)